MNWKSKKEIRTDLFLILGMVIIIIGFTLLIGFSMWPIIIVGVIILGIGIYCVLKSLGKREYPFFEGGKKK
jgi:uncharacterized membrane protein